MNKYKFNLFLTIKQKVLKKIKDQQIDERIQLLRKVKAARTLVILIDVAKRLRILSNNVNTGRERMINRIRMTLCKHKIQNRFRQQINVNYQHYKHIVERDHKRYLIPVFKFFNTNLRQGRASDHTIKTLICKFLLDMKKKNQIKLKIKQTVDTIINFQRLVKAYFKKKRLWEALIYIELEREKKHMIDFIKMILGPARQKFDFILVQLQELEENSMKVICKNFVQYTKDVHVLNTYRYNLDFLGSQITVETIEGAKSNIIRTRDLCFSQYTEAELSPYPIRFESEAGKVDSFRRKSTKKLIKLKTSHES